jgi:hypothetical protein
MVLARLLTAGMRVNMSKFKVFPEQIEGIQPIRNKVEAILNIKVPKKRKEEPALPVYCYNQLIL